MACCICIKYSTYTFQTNSSLQQIYEEVIGYITGMNSAFSIVFYLVQVTILIDTPIFPKYIYI